MPQGQRKININKWKDKAILRRIENKKLKARIKELIESRYLGKRSAMALKTVKTLRFSMKKRQ